jgi:orotidine-5'-phosphate decarboxylase
VTAKIFCAIDTTDADKARDLALMLTGIVDGFKLGLEFFAANGPSAVRDIRRVCIDDMLFLDLKLHDIPNTVAGAVRGAMRCEADFLTLHTSGGPEMMRAAYEAAHDEQEKTGYRAPKLLGVTVLTSLDDATLTAVGQETPAAKQVARLGGLARASGLQGVVCSPREIKMLRQELGPDAVLVVPGIRPADSAADDQKRVMTPGQASEAGADWLVIGRPITGAKDPVKAAKEIVESLK